MSITKFIPIVGQIKSYNTDKLSHDLIAAMVVTVMLIPQSLAYAMFTALSTVTQQGIIGYAEGAILLALLSGVFLLLMGNYLFSFKKYKRI